MEIEVLVSFEDADLATFEWDIFGGYAVRNSYGADGYHILLRLATIVLERLLGRTLESWEEVDHVNRNKLDNRRDNLRAVSRSKNCLNKSLQSNNTSGYRGVHKHGMYWRARIYINGKPIHIGLYETPEEASTAYLNRYLQEYGEYPPEMNEKIRNTAIAL